MGVIPHLSDFEKLKAPELKLALNHAAQTYYAGDPEYMDDVYDAALQHYQTLTGDSGAVLAESISDGFEHARHEWPMLSLTKVTQFDEVKTWLSDSYQRLQEVNAQVGVEVQWKLDGLSLSLIYREGRLLRAVTRGTGVMGDVVTAQALACVGVPAILPDKCVVRDVEVRGEIIISLEDFSKVNQEQVEAGQPTFANPRNLAAGTLKAHNPKLATQRRLRFVACDALSQGDVPAFRVGLETNVRTWLASIGFETVPSTEAIFVDAVGMALAEIQVARQNASLRYPTDGAVVKLRARQARQLLGSSSTAPRWALAFKFPPVQAETRILDVVWQIGKHGTLTPVAELEPVTLDGSVVRRASLHNVSYLRNLNMHHQDRVVVIKANDIIPQILRVSETMASLGYVTPSLSKPPEKCPFCQSPVTQEQGKEALRCSNPANCRGTLAERMAHFVSKHATDMRGVGPVVLQRWVEFTHNKNDDFYGEEELRWIAASVESIVDGSLIAYCKDVTTFSEKQVANMQASIEEGKKVTPDRLLYGMSIPHVGRTVSQHVMHAYGSITQMLAGISQCESIAGVGAVALQSLQQWCDVPTNANMLRRMVMQHGCNNDMPGSELVSDKLKGLVICITGELSRDREAFEHIIKAHGGRATTSVSGKTTHLLQGENPGATKVNKAAKHGTTVIDESQFWRLIEATAP